MNLPVESPRDPVLQEDLEMIGRDTALSAALRGKKILITGATGLVGSQLLRALACMNRLQDNGMLLTGVIRSKQKARSIYGEEFLRRQDVQLVCGDITDPGFVPDAYAAILHGRSVSYAGSEENHADLCQGNAPDGRRAELPMLDLVIHGAAVTSSGTMVEKPVETIMTAVVGTKHLLDLAVKTKAEAFVYLSSMEIYGDLAHEAGQSALTDRISPACGCGSRSDSLPESPMASSTGIVSPDSAGYERISRHPGGGNLTLATEDRLGWLDLSSVRSDYPESKRLCENLCVGYGKEYGIRVEIARLAQTFGAGVLPGENRVFAQFARSAARGEDIVLHTRGLSEGNYCYTRDAVRGILTIATRGVSGQAYNVANEETHMSIAQMARMVAERIAGSRVRVVFDIPEDNRFGYAADVRLRLDASRLRALGWVPEVGLEEMYRRLIASMRATGEFGT